MQTRTVPFTSRLRRLGSALAALSDGSFVAFALILFLLFSAPLFLRWLPPMADEEMFGDVARTFAEHFRLASTLIAGQEHGMYWQPPLYFLLLAPVIKMFGWSLAVLRGFSLFIGILVVVLTYLLGKSLTSQLAARIGTIFLVCNPFFVVYIKYGRMDGLCLLFILLSLLLVLGSMQRQEPKAFLIPGIAVAGAVLTHPLGLIAPMSILIWLIIGPRRGIKNFAGSVAWLLLPTIAGLGLWFIFILQDPQAFLTQMQYQLTRKDRGWSGFFMGFLSRYRFLPLVLAVGLLGLLGTWHIWRSRRGVALLLLLTASVVSFIVVGVRFELPYHVYWASFAGLGAGVAAVEMPSRWRFAFKVLLLAGLVNGLLYFAYVTYAIHWKERTAPGYNELSHSVAAMLPASASVMTAGYPTLYWGLRAERPDVRYIEKVYFDSSLAREVVGRLDYFIVTRSFAPQEDASELAGQLRSIDSLASRVNKKVVLVGEIGEEKRFVPSAKVYKLISSSDASRIPP